MMRTSLVVLCLLLSAAPASAECAWVLWARETRHSLVENTTSETWDTETGASTEARCGAQLRGKIAWFQRTMKDGTAKEPKDETMYHKVIEDRTVSLYFYRKTGSPDDPPLRTQTITWICLPDTVDPRGPKTK